MSERLGIRPNLTLFPLNESSWGFASGSEEVWELRFATPDAAAIFQRCAPLLDGQMTADEMVSTLNLSSHEAGLLEFLINSLRKSGLLGPDELFPTPNTRDSQQEQLIFLSRFSDSGASVAREKVATTRVALVTIGWGNLTLALLHQLKNTGIEYIEVLNLLNPRMENVKSSLGDVPVISLAPESLEASIGVSKCGVIIVAQQNPANHLLEAVDAISKKRAIPWMLVRVNTFEEGWVGPIFVPGETASYISLEARYRGNLEHAKAYLALQHSIRSGSAQPKALPITYSAASILSSIAATELMYLLSGTMTSTLLGAFLTVNMLDWTTESHRVLRLPREESECAVSAAYPWNQLKYDHDTRRG